LTEAIINGNYMIGYKVPIIGLYTSEVQNELCCALTGYISPFIMYSRSTTGISHFKISTSIAQNLHFPGLQRLSPLVT